jgi:hypothetical protein
MPAELGDDKAIYPKIGNFERLLCRAIRNLWYGGPNSAII